MLKNNIRSIRFSDEMMDIINQQVGDNFNQKFERLVYNCYMVLPQREKEICKAEERLAYIRSEYDVLKKRLSSLQVFERSLSDDLHRAELHVQNIIKG